MVAQPYTPCNRCVGVWTDTRVDTTPRTPLSVGLVYVYRGSVCVYVCVCVCV